ncbi:hypothetical protein CONPUDRAFT_161815 [Coniophora puteana RWD-64-598 SS2]|uniref:Uncharacterized protein n=1 Tax=Coniophora puteana (strain RWD-64-598) TaxID=741705 RepID=A0A5M3N717_CONPW|nr:uncharacterized protein CONPUDRAFT_161815 [Coniophora puteana RWD-64-598 SS2]EIW87232.1 hypothetical protein CONPUDRAFT_161815 [Coniophora puteana RWD-64-598 SS2]
MGFFKKFFNFPQKTVECNVSIDLTTSSYFPRRLFHSSRKAPRAQNIPIEIVLNILEAAYYDDDLNPNTDLLKNCALVCHAWSIHAQKLLFRQVSLRTQPAFTEFTRAIDSTSPRGQLLANSVLRMRLVLDHNQPNGLSQSSLAHAVTHCPNLYELTLSLYGCADPGQDIVGSPAAERMRRPAPSFDASTLELLRTGPRISALHFTNWSENEQTLAQLLEVWSSLRSLTITGKAPARPSADAPPVACAFEELRINCQKEPSLDTLTWLLQRSADVGTLRSLEFEREPSAAVLSHLVDNHAETLQALALPTCTTAEQAEAIARCEELKELRTEGAAVPAAVYRQLPEGIQHLSFGLDADTALQPVIDAVKLCEELTTVTVHVWSSGEKHSLLNPLKMACAFAGVDLRLIRDVRTLRTIVRGDPIVPESFPRAKTLENLQLMRCPPPCHA